MVYEEGEMLKPYPQLKEELPVELQRRLDEMYISQLSEVSKMHKLTKKEFKHYNDLPLARIKRIMKSDEDVDMISAEAPILFAKACELFILDVSIRANYEAETQKRQSIENDDFYHVFHTTCIFDFLSQFIQEVQREAEAEQQQKETTDSRIRMQPTGSTLDPKRFRN